MRLQQEFLRQVWFYTWRTATETRFCGVVWLHIDVWKHGRDDTNYLRFRIPNFFRSEIPPCISCKRPTGVPARGDRARARHPHKARGN